jgi:hypothetical protein
MWRSALLGVVLAGLLAGCGSGLARQRPDVTGPGLGAATASPATARLARLAHAQAQAAGNPHPQLVAYVSSHRRVAVKVSEGGDIVDSNQPVFVVEVVGPFPHYRRHSPADVNPSMRCQAVSFTVEQATWQILDAGCGAAFNISELGRAYRLP